ncbi:MAG: DUF1924 domain-containing protein [Myxococcota bacterium]
MRIVPWMLAAAFAAPPAVDGLLAQYRAAGATAPDAGRGQTLWTTSFPAPDGGAARACTTCHGPTLGSPGRHATTGEPITPMASADRFTDAAKIEKWFGRNCRWTVGRDCTPAEKADLLTWLTGGAK